jgi:UPF0755 protein
MKLLKILFLLFIVSILAASGVAYWLYSSLNEPHAHDKTGKFIRIEKGSTPNQIIAKLASEGVIESETPTLVYLRTFGDAEKLQAGDYNFSSPITPLEVIAELEKGKERTVRLTIPEGFTRFDKNRRKIPAKPAGR